MEKIRPQAKNESYQEYCKAIKEKLDEIVEFVNRVDISGYPQGADLPPEFGGERPVDTKGPDGD